MTIIKKLSVYLFVSALLLTVTPNAQALGASALLGEGRYFVSTERGIVKTLFGARYEFEGGFTADLTKGELWALKKIFRISVEEVALWNINEGSAALGSLESLFNFPVVDDATSEEEDGETKVDRENRPDNTISWGTKVVYGNLDLATTTGGEGVTVAVLDTGIKRDHLDLAERVSGCVDFTRSSIIKNTCDDKNGHGTHVAGIIAADGGSDKEGIWGVAPETGIFVYKVCRKDGSCWADDVAAAISYATENEVDILSMSFGGENESPLVKNAIAGAAENNILMVSSVGNNGPDNAGLYFPAAHKEVVAVGAIDESGEIPEWTSVGANNGDYILAEGEVEFVAPGVNIESTWNDEGYRYLSGTSLASSFIVGLAAKLWDGVATSTRATLQSLAQDIGELGDDELTGFGLPILPR